MGLRGPKTRDQLSRFLPLIAVQSDGCWHWLGYIRKGTGYAQFYTSPERPVDTAHRWSYEYFIGPIPDGLQIDHLCRVRHCVNPTHLEPVTPQVNIQRASPFRPPIVPAPYCIHGHLLRTLLSGRRYCPKCALLRTYAYRAAHPDCRRKERRAS